jgi:hypothetical protein
MIVSRTSGADQISLGLIHAEQVLLHLLFLLDVTVAAPAQAGR